MTEKPILFSAAMIEQILAGNKTQTRRLIKSKGLDGHGCMQPWVCPYGKVGDSNKSRLWVREAHAIVPRTAYVCSIDDGVNQLPHRVSPDGLSWAVYRQGWTRCTPGKWRPSIHMPRWACRLVLDVKEIRAERLQDITVEDIIAEGFSTRLREHDAVCDLRDQFAAAWDKIHGTGAYKKNPWVWVVSFEVVKA